MALVVFDVEKAKPITRAALGKLLLEVRPGVFVGALSKRAVDQLWEIVCGDSCAIVLLVYPAKNELGVNFRQKGQHRYALMDHYGLPLVAFKKIGSASTPR